jgi:hypothetical protein
LNQDETDADCGGTICGACPPKCGNGVIETGENCANCPFDIQCEAGKTCQNKKCLSPPFPFWIVFMAVIGGGAVIFATTRIVKNKKDARQKMLSRMSSAISYVINASNAGTKDDAIKESLLKAGWSQSQVGFAIKEAKKQLKKSKK